MGAVVGAVSCSEATSSIQAEEAPKNRVGAAQYEGNRLNEDRFCVKLFDSKKLGLAVFDGHGGWQVADYLSHRLLPKINDNITALEKAGKHSDTFAVSRALEDAFGHCEEELRAKVEPAVNMKYSRLGAVGSCALCVLVDPQYLFVANAGDCRALLVRGAQPIALSNIHNADNPSEQARLKKEHPGEEDIVICKSSVVQEKGNALQQAIRTLTRGKTPQVEEVLSSCYVKGRLQPTRSFGDFYMKHAKFQFDFETNKPFVKAPLSFPYITACPEVTVFARHPSDELLVLASDGLWDYLAYEEVVEIAMNFLKKSEPNDCVLLAQKLIDEAMARAATLHELDMATIRRIPPGPTRRQIHDDITVIAVRL